MAHKANQQSLNVNAYSQYDCKCCSCKTVCCDGYRSVTLTKTQKEMGSGDECLERCGQSSDNASPYLSFVNLSSLKISKGHTEYTKQEEKKEMRDGEWGRDAMCDEQFYTVSETCTMVFPCRCLRKKPES